MNPDPVNLKMSKLWHASIIFQIYTQEDKDDCPSEFILDNNLVPSKIKFYCEWYGRRGGE